MKGFFKIVWVFLSAVMLCFTSCLNEAADPESGEKLPANLATLEEQVAAMKSSLEVIESLQDALAQTSEFQGFAVCYESCAVSVKEHVANVESGLSGVTAVTAAMDLQVMIARAAGILKAELSFLPEEDAFRDDILALERSVSAWLGKDFNRYFAVSAELARLEVVLEVVEGQSLSADAITSDVEAGLRVGDASGLGAVREDIGRNSDVLTSLVKKMTDVCTEVEQGYSSAISGSDVDIKVLNTKAASALSESELTFADLATRLSACEAALEEIENRLTKVEAEVDALLGMIQSVTFLSDYSEEYAVAYYEMSKDKISAPGKPYDGKALRTKAGTIELSYMVRPAAAASAVTAETADVFGYYAERIQTRAVSQSDFVDFQIQSVAVVNSELGIVTVKVAHDLKDDFYYKETGAKCALSIASGKTDITSKFVELVPKDNSATVYVEEIRINTDDFAIDEGQSKTLSATVNPSSATNKTVTWTSSDPSLVSVDPVSGVLKAEKQGNATITVTTNGVDEWGDNLSASVKVKVNSAIRLGGPLYVEVGKPAELSLDFPPAMNVESKVWMSSDATKATVENGIVTGVAHTYNQYTYQYNPITITCIVNGNITLTHEMDVVVPQPRQIKLNNYGDDVKSVSMKLDQTISLAGSILPANVDASLFRMTYESDGGLGWINFDTGEIKAPGSVGGRYVYIKVKDRDKHTYMKTFVERTVIVNVEPYYVETMKFAQENVSLPPGQTSQISPILTSDVDGKQPTYREMTWTSSNPQVASVDTETGLITTHTEGNTVITATITPEAVPSGAEPLSASFTLIVETPVAPINVGDFFYSDGTWSTERDNTKTVIGIIFSNTPATADSKLMTDYSQATHGLVVGIKEYNHHIGYLSNVGGSSDSGVVLKDRCDIFNEGVSNGYTNTYHLSNYSNEKGVVSGYNLDNGASVYYAELFHPTMGVLADVTTARPQGVSTWYIPSYNEMFLMKTNLDKINSSLTAAGGDALSGVYWTSTFKQHYSWNGAQGSLDATAGYNMSNGSWTTYNTGAYKQINPVRVIFAF